MVSMWMYIGEGEGLAMCCPSLVRQRADVLQVLALLLVQSLCERLVPRRVLRLQIYNHNHHNTSAHPLIRTLSHTDVYMNDSLSAL